MRTAERDQLRYGGLRPSDIARDLGCTPEHVVQLIRDGTLQGINIGRGKKPEFRVRGESYERFLRERSVNPEESAA